MILLPTSHHMDGLNIKLLIASTTFECLVGENLCFSTSLKLVCGKHLLKVSRNELTVEQ